MQWPESPKLWTRKNVLLQSPKNVCTRCLVVVTTMYESVKINHVSHFQAAWEKGPSKSIWQNRKRTINQSVQHVCCTWSVMLKPMLMCRLCVSSLKLIKVCLEVCYTCSFMFVLFSTLSCRVDAFETFSLLLLSSKFSALSHNPLLYNKTSPLCWAHFTLIHAQHNTTATSWTTGWTAPGVCSWESLPSLAVSRPLAVVQSECHSCWTSAALPFEKWRPANSQSRLNTSTHQHEEYTNLQRGVLRRDVGLGGVEREGVNPQNLQGHVLTGLW